MVSPAKTRCRARQLKLSADRPRTARSSIAWCNCPFESGVIVITDWKQNNYLRNDRYTPTIYKAERERLSCVQSVYVLDAGGIPIVYHRETQVGREEDRKRQTPLNKNEDKLSSARIDAHFQKGRNLLRKKMTGETQ